MPSYDEAVVVDERHEFRIPIHGDQLSGVCWTDVYSAVSVAHNQLRALKLIDEERDAADNVIRIAGDEEHVIVFYTLRRDGERLRLV